MNKVLSLGKPTAIVLMAGSSIDLQQAGDKAHAVLLGWYPGARGGKTVADILLGKVSPSGKLPLTFYKNEQLALMPDFTDYAMRGRTYRYFEHEPLYSFGYGLTYGDSYCVSAKAVREDGKILIDAVIRNDGRATQDVVQVYVQNEESENAPRNPRLCAFVRVTIDACAEKTIRLEIDEKKLQVVNQSGQWTFEGRPVLYVGMGQPDARSFALTGHASVKIEL